MDFTSQGFFHMHPNYREENGFECLNVHQQLNGRVVSSSGLVGTGRRFEPLLRHILKLYLKRVFSPASRLQIRKEFRTAE